MSISRIFDISKSSLAAYQQAMDVTSNNISNASNPDYSRQVVKFETETPQQMGNFSWGSGVRIGDIQRVRDQLTDAQIRANNQKYSADTMTSNLLGQIESVFTEPSDLGLSNLINNFFNSWQQLAVTPNSASLRQNVIYAANKVSEKVKSINDSFDIIKNDISSQFKSDVDKLNSLLMQVQDLNTQIFKSQARGATPNDLLDQRDKAIDELSKLANINVSYDSNNSATIAIGGVLAADNANYTQFKVGQKDGKLVLTAADGTSKIALTSGELFSLSDVYSNKLPGYQEQLSTIVQSIFDNVNQAHSQGTTITDPSQTNVNFFESYNNGELKINQKILDDPSMIAVSADGTSGNGDIAITLGDLANKKVLNGNTISDTYSSLVSGIGNDKNSADQSASARELVLQQLNQQKASYSGVSIDEEMTNVIKFQRAYDASAKLIKVADTMLQTLINMV